MRRLLSISLSCILASVGSAQTPASRAAVQLQRVPGGGVQPEVAVDQGGAVHVVYLAGEPGAANVYYVRSTDEGRTFTQPIRVNSQDGSAIATGTVRGAQIAVGRGGRVHIAWNGSDIALPKPPIAKGAQRAGMPMLYARSNDAGTAFEPQRNLMTRTSTLDGGGSIAADQRGNVYVAWHANASSDAGGEDARRVWIARSSNDGAAFSPEWPISDPKTGVCGCCGLRMLAAGEREVHVMYRSATSKVHRDMYSLVSTDRGATFKGGRTDAWEIGACPMTTASIANGTPSVRAWETDGQVYFRVKSSDRNSPANTASPQPLRRKHPRVVVNQHGTILLAWAEGTAWARGGAVEWQLFGPEGRPTGAVGRQPGLPVWSFPAVIARRDGTFVVLY